MPNPDICWQINLQESFGGGEVYTGFLSRALSDLGVKTNIFVSKKANFWSRVLPESATVIPVTGINDVFSHLPESSAWVLSHGGIQEDAAKTIASRHLLTGIAHMPLYGRSPSGFLHHKKIYSVSAYVRDTLLAFFDADRVDGRPLYGIAKIPQLGADANQIIRASRYDWDRRKGRDRLLGFLEPLVLPLMPQRVWEKKPGITLGIVSRITPIKQFPLLFSYIADRLAKFPQINLEIFGAGGYASIRDTEKSLSPIRKQVRFWGHQSNVGEIYRSLDYLLTGLPEKEALGLNVIEAQSVGLPVMAVSAPPFTETVLHGQTGWLYPDPRQDGGEGFEKMLKVLAAGERLKPAGPDVEAHLQKFSFEAFRERLAALIQDPLFKG